MKVWITKKDPLEFVFRGMDCLTIWFSKPEFLPASHMGCFGEHEIDYAMWRGDYYLSGRVLRKMKNQASEDVWKALKHTYLGWDSRDLDLYEPVSNYYWAALQWGHKNERLFLDYSTIVGKMTKKERAEKESFVISEAIREYAESLVEKKGMGWREWCFEYELELNVSV